MKDGIATTIALCLTLSLSGCYSSTGSVSTHDVGLGVGYTLTDLPAVPQRLGVAGNMINDRFND